MKLCLLPLQCIQTFNTDTHRWIFIVSYSIFYFKFNTLNLILYNLPCICFYTYTCEMWKRTEVIFWINQAKKWPQLPRYFRWSVSLSLSYKDNIAILYFTCIGKSLEFRVEKCWGQWFQNERKGSILKWSKNLNVWLLFWLKVRKLSFKNITLTF